MSDTPTETTTPDTETAAETRARRTFPIRLMWAHTASGPWSLEPASPSFSTMEQAQAWCAGNGTAGRVYLRVRVQGEAMRIPPRELELIEI